MPIYLQMIASITSSAPPPIESRPRGLCNTKRTVLLHFKSMTLIRVPHIIFDFKVDATCCWMSQYNRVTAQNSQRETEIWAADQNREKHYDNIIQNPCRCRLHHCIIDCFSNWIRSQVQRFPVFPCDNCGISIPMYLQMIASITSSAPPPMDHRRMSLWKRKLSSA